jgi:hypothetical protein
MAYLSNHQIKENSRLTNCYDPLIHFTILKPEHSKPNVLSIGVAFLPGLDKDLINLLLSCDLTVTIPIINYCNEG